MLIPFRLELTDSREDGWHWRLVDLDGRMYKDHTVSLTEAERRELCESASRCAQLDKKAEEDLRVEIGTALLGDIAGVLAQENPSTVVVRVPRGESWLMELPLEAAAVRDQDGAFVGLAELQVGFLFCKESLADVDWTKQPAEPLLRILAVFAEGPEGDKSRLHDEYRELADKMVSSARSRNKGVEVAVLGYDATRETLEARLSEAAGWDVVYISGYNLRTGLELWGDEHADDRMRLRQVARLLKFTKARLKAVILVDHKTTPHQGRPDDFPENSADPPGPSPNGSGAALQVDESYAALDELSCSVVVFRRPVCEFYAARFGELLFDYLVDKEHRLPGAMQFAIAKIHSQINERADCHCRTPACSIVGNATPDPSLRAPTVAKKDFNPDGLRMAGFPARPERVSMPKNAMRKATDALRDRSGHLGVLLFGEYREGLVCALELAYQRRDEFEAVVWFDAGTMRPFRDFASAVDAKLVNLRMSERAGSIDDLKAFIPNFIETLKERRILTVLHRIDVLLTPQGTWREPLWEDTMNALVLHDGVSRLVMTSTRMVVEDTGRRSRLLVTPVPSVSAGKNS